MQSGSPPITSTHAADGSVAPELRAALADAVALYRGMVTLRLVSARMVALQRDLRVAVHTSCLGEEAVIVGATLAARPSDWVFPGTREWGAAILRGLPIAQYMHHAFGSQADLAKGHSAPDHPPARRFRVAAASGAAGAHLPHAVGVAWAAKIAKEDVAAVALFGEAATSSGDFHNAVNFAGVFKPACVLVCRNDGRERFATTRDRAIAYGVASAEVDGSDALAVLTVVRAALARGVEGKGATLVEAVTKPVTAERADFPETVWKGGGSELLALGEADPIPRLRRALEREGLLDAAAHDAMLREIRVSIDAAVAEAERAGPPAPCTLFEDLYAGAPAPLHAAIPARHH